MKLYAVYRVSGSTFLNDTALRQQSIYNWRHCNSIAIQNMAQKEEPLFTEQLLDNRSYEFTLR